jgi:hypothetical protein
VKLTEGQYVVLKRVRAGKNTMCGNDMIINLFKGEMLDVRCKDSLAEPGLILTNKAYAAMDKYEAGL